MKDYVLSDVLRDAAEGETTEAMKTVRVCSVEEFRGSSCIVVGKKIKQLHWKAVV